jgi:CRP/FNR family cyclic AMP-dependent transcriptional regulator
MPQSTAFSQASRSVPTSGALALLEVLGIDQAGMDYGRGETIFSQGETGDDVLYVQSGGVKLSVVSRARGRVVVGTLGPGDFFGDGCLVNQPLRSSTATAITPTVIRTVGKHRMNRLLHTHPALCDCFISNMLSRTMRVEVDLARQLFKTKRTRELL